MFKKKWYEYLWIWPVIYFSLGFFNIIFAWLELIDFLVPLYFAIFKGNKNFCNRYCGRGQFFAVVGKRFGWQKNSYAPIWLTSKWFRYGFLTFFLLMFSNMLFQTWLVASGAENLEAVVKLFWTVQVPWSWAYTAGSVPDWVAKFSFGLYGLMLTSMIIGIVVMALYKPRTWCSFCPMGTATQGICKLKNKQ